MNSSAKQDYKKLSAKFDKVSIREQFLIFCCGLVVVTLLSYSLFIEPLTSEIKRAQKKSTSTKLEISKLSKELADIGQKLKHDPNSALLTRLESLSAEIESIDKQIHAQTEHLVPAKAMAAMLESVLLQTKGLKLLELKSIPPVPVLVDAESADDNSSEAIYRHGVTLVFEGSYFDIQGYLQQIESLHWQFHWKKFDYVVLDYPQSRVELEIYTLSTNKAFIGV